MPIHFDEREETQYSEVLVARSDVAMLAEELTSPERVYLQDESLGYGPHTTELTRAHLDSVFTDFEKVQSWREIVTTGGDVVFENTDSDGVSRQICWSCPKTNTDGQATVISLELTKKEAGKKQEIPHDQVSIHAVTTRVRDVVHGVLVTLSYDPAPENMDTLSVAYLASPVPTFRAPNYEHLE
jgi:hypothetical protein